MIEEKSIGHMNERIYTKYVNNNTYYAVVMHDVKYFHFLNICKSLECIFLVILWNP